MMPSSDLKISNELDGFSLNELDEELKEPPRRSPSSFIEGGVGAN